MEKVMSYLLGTLTSVDANSPSYISIETAIKAASELSNSRECEAVVVWDHNNEIVALFAAGKGFLPV